MGVSEERIEKRTLSGKRSGGEPIHRGEGGEQNKRGVPGTVKISEKKDWSPKETRSYL